jgi:hypothetical protein
LFLRLHPPYLSFLFFSLFSVEVITEEKLVLHMDREGVVKKLVSSFLLFSFLLLLSGLVMHRLLNAAVVVFFLFISAGSRW